jgi:hypothetical protein
MFDLPCRLASQRMCVVVRMRGLIVSFPHVHDSSSTVKFILRQQQQHSLRNITSQSSYYWFTVHSYIAARLLFCNIYSRQQPNRGEHALPNISLLTPLLVRDGCHALLVVVDFRLPSRTDPHPCCRYCCHFLNLLHTPSILSIAKVTGKRSCENTSDHFLSWTLYSTR